ncbi:hypothetical protein [Streptomyces katsurahamanus]|uniref:DUF4242 domain-containing protein n=1 Tax=Streptomyces katsurahamanus TaxID=2577098 RepID=A0ABW9NUD9_9ACTN|nr:hypothetical protein [Streptomyces katsurahamanus]MQS36922.1 hypothetical protein [Streptomyces katsurahamanus]
MRRRRSMVSSRTTVAVREWDFILHLQEPLTPEQSDTLDGLDRFNDGRICLIEGPGWAKFTCTFSAETLTGAIAEALGFFEDFPGVLIRSVELGPRELEENKMATTAVVRAPV